MAQIDFGGSWSAWSDIRNFVWLGLGRDLKFNQLLSGSKVDSMQLEGLLK